MYPRAAILAAILACLLVAPSGAAARGNPLVFTPGDLESTRAFRYAAYDGDRCLQELDRRGVPYERLEATPNVQTPVRLTGPVRGVTFKPTWRAEPNPLAPATIADCRLALAIDDLARVLAAHDVVEAEYLSMYRPRRGAIPGRRHPAGLAMDLATIKLSSGQMYSVRSDFHGRVGATTCGEKAAKPTRETVGAVVLREIACQLGDDRTFNLVLTPNYDWGHRDHFHLEVRTGIRWYLVQ